MNISNNAPVEMVAGTLVLKDDATVLEGMEYLESCLDNAATHAHTTTEGWDEYQRISALYEKFEEEYGAPELTEA